jgi:NAD(P)-dependent dehydrogenase (short-subunit alcohol dehydrogenase family)
MAAASARPVALVVGAGEATGGAIAKRFARGGYTVCLARRNAQKLQPLVDEIRAGGGEAHGFATDARNEDEVHALFDDIEARIGAVEVFVFNVGANARAGILEESARKYFELWETGCFAGFLTARKAAHCMAPRGKGTILFTGATASLRGSAQFAAFAGAKAALRALAQSMARELGPRGIHVAHVVVDGGIDTALLRANFPERHALKGREGILNPDHIAENYWMLHMQPRDAWTHELDLRPWIEKF